MAKGAADAVLRHIRCLVAAPTCDPLSDQELLRRFARQHDETAFTTLVRRHGGMVLHVAERVLQNHHDAEDVFQATFLALSRRAGSRTWQHSISNWLYTVAYRLALRVQVQAQLHASVETQRVGRVAADPLAVVSGRELCVALDEELHGLPERYRMPLILCCLEGVSRDEAAAQLGWSLGALKGRLERGRTLLRQRLAWRGFTLPAVLAAELFTDQATRAAVPPWLVQAALRTVGEPAARVLTLAQAVNQGLRVFMGKAVLAAILLACGGSLGAGLVLQSVATTKPMEEKPAEASKPAPVGNGPRQAPDKKPLLDRHGDTLPEGAMARLGTLCWRAGTEVSSLAYAADGKTLAALSRGGVYLFDTGIGKVTKRFRPFDAPVGVGRLAFSPDGQRLLVCLASRPGGRMDRVQIWELSEGRKTREEDAENVRWVGWSATGQPLAAYLGEGNLLLRELAGGKEKRFEAENLPPPTRGLPVCAFAAGGKVLAVPDQFGVIHVWDAATTEKRCTFRVKTNSVAGLALSPDGLCLASLIWDHKGDTDKSIVQFWDVATGKELHTLVAEKESVRAIDFTPNGKMLVTVSSGKGARFWDVATGRECGRTMDSPGFAEAVAFSPDGQTLAAAEANSGAIHRWDVATGKPRPEPAGHSKPPYLVAFSPDGRRVATGSLDETIFLWDAATSDRLAEVRRPSKLVRGCAFSADGQTLYSLWHDGQLYFADAVTGRALHTFQLEDPIRPDTRQSGTYLLLSDDRRSLVALSYYYPKQGDGPYAQELLVTGWDVASRKELFRRRRDKADFGLTVSADAWVLAASQSGGHGPTRLEDLATGEPLLTLPAPPEGQTMPLAFSPDGRLLATITYGPVPPVPADDDRVAGQATHTLRVWEVATATELLAIPTVYNARFAFSPDSRVLALSAPVREILLWDLRRGKDVRRLRGFDVEVKSLAFSPDGNRLVSGLSDSTLLVWDVSTVGKAREPSGLGSQEADQAWADLAANSQKAFAARWALAGAPDRAVPLLRARLQPARPADATRLRRLLADLDSDRFAVREAAYKGLEAWGELAAPAFRQALKEKPSLEVSRRIEGLLEKLRGPVTQPETLRVLRAVAVLEDIATPEARSVLEGLAQGAPAARLTQAAKAARERLARRDTLKP
jgi:RNA polymerase sigma factor (sigma-70 family)